MLYLLKEKILTPPQSIPTLQSAKHPAETARKSEQQGWGDGDLIVLGHRKKLRVESKAGKQLCRQKSGYQIITAPAQFSTSSFALRDDRSTQLRCLLLPRARQAPAVLHIHICAAQRTMLA